MKNNAGTTTVVVMIKGENLDNLILTLTLIYPDPNSNPNPDPLTCCNVIVLTL